MITPTLKTERKLWKRGVRYVAGIDEVGRGPLAGPLVVAAVCVNPAFRVAGDLKLVRDSKLLSANQRERVAALSVHHPNIVWSIGEASSQTIDRVSLQKAWHTAAASALANLEKKLDHSLEHIIIDGHTLLHSVAVSQTAIPKGDQTVFSCSLASIIAKVHRDKMMVEYHATYPAYGFDTHKGYGTKSHILALKSYGPCPIHRKSFAPVSESILKEHV